MEEAGWWLEGHTQTSASKKSSEQIGAIRSQIDKLDESIASMLAQRLALAGELTEAKVALGLPIKDGNREAQVLEKVASQCSEPAVAEAICSIYESIMCQSRKLQQEKKLLPGSATSDEPVPGTQTAGNRKNPLYFPRVLIVGLGLIGGALARQVKRVLPETIITACDRPEILAEALAQQVVDRTETDLAKALRKADLILLAASPEQNLLLLKQIASGLSRRQLIVDVTSTKSQICKLAEKLNLNGADFIGGHPFFGSEKSGLAGSGELNTQDKVFCLVPTTGTSEISLRRLSRWLTALNFRVAVTDATTHDAVAAKISHLVQLLAIVLGVEVRGNLSDEELKKLLLLSGPSFAQTARLMASPPELWLEILGQNREAILAAVESFDDRLKQLRKAIKGNDKKAIADLFKKAQAIPRLLSE
jgi:prephenate dehydrogenase